MVMPTGDASGYCDTIKLSKQPQKPRTSSCSSDMYHQPQLASGEPTEITMQKNITM